jgi:hypothetical protein
MRRTLSPKISLQDIIPLVGGTSAAMMLDQGFLFTTKRAKDTKNGEPNYKSDRILTCFLSAFVLFVSFVVVYSG